ncbi:MAG: metal ABC transporter permease [Victivallaceae bacterium]
MSSVLGIPFFSGCIAVVLVCMTSAIWGVFLLLSNKSLIGETVSHASYPGLLMGVIVGGISQCFGCTEFWVVLLGFVSAILGFFCVNLLESRFCVNRDSSLCVVLIVSFGIGITLSSYVRGAFPEDYSKVQSYLYGQAATLGSFDLILSLILIIATAIVVCLFYRFLLTSTFDPEYSVLNGLSLSFTRYTILIFVSLVVVVGIRSVGVILISAMFVGPPLAAGRFFGKLWQVIIGSMIFGGISGLIGCLVSLFLSIKIGNRNFYLPTGPLIVLASGGIVVLALVFSTDNGLFIRAFRKSSFLFRRQIENLLKVIWMISEEGHKSFSKKVLFGHYKFKELFSKSVFIEIYLKYLCRKRLIKIDSFGKIRLSGRGNREAVRLIRLHRLWEAYLVGSLAFSAVDVHPLAEEIEHVLTSEMDKSLTELLKDPVYDPHNRIIPKINDEEYCD